MLSAFAASRPGRALFAALPVARAITRFATLPRAACAASALAFTMLATFGLAPAAAFAQAAQGSPGDDPQAPQTRTTRQEIRYVINPDGTYEETREFEIKLLTQEAIGRMRRAAINYSESIQKAKVLTAYTLKADGKKVPVPDWDYQVQAAAGAGGNASDYSDNVALSVTFPELEVGDSVVFGYRLTATEPLFPKQFSVAEVISPLTPYDAYVLRIDAPASMWAQYKAVGLTETQNTEKNGRKLLEFHYANPRPARNTRLNFTVMDAEKTPGLFYSTFRSYKEIAEVYGARAYPKAAVTPRVQQLADEIAGPVAKAGKPPREVARALYDWVTLNISFAGNCIGLGAVVPRDIDFILDKHMGDCKDHSTLLQALLAARGIKSEQVLLNAANNFRLPQVPVVAMVNHVINYLPDFDLYADSSSEDTPFGMLPFNISDKPTLMVSNYREGTRTPAMAVGSNEQQMKTHVRIAPDGGIRADIDVSLRGTYAVAARTRFRELPPGADEGWVRSAFQSQGLFASGKVAHEDAAPLESTYKYSVKFEVERFLPIPAPGGGAFNINPLFYNEAPTARFAAPANGEVDPANESVCGNGRSVEEYQIDLPANMKVTSLPPNARVETPLLSYTATYALKGNSITVRRVVDDRTKGNVCSPATMQAVHDFAVKVRENLQAQVKYQ